MHYIAHMASKPRTSAILARVGRTVRSRREHAGLTIREVAYSGVSWWLDAARRADFALAGGQAVTRAEVDAAAARLREGYHAAGWPEARVAKTATRAAPRRRPGKRRGGDACR